MKFFSEILKKENLSHRHSETAITTIKEKNKITVIKQKPGYSVEIENENLNHIFWVDSKSEVLKALLKPEVFIKEQK